MYMQLKAMKTSYKTHSILQAMYMELKGIPTSRSSWAITLLSFAECITYMIASFLGDKLKGRLVYVNCIAATALSVVCLSWPFMDVNYGVIMLMSISKYHSLPQVPSRTD